VTRRGWRGWRGVAPVAGKEGRAPGQDEGRPGVADELGQQPPQPVVWVGPVGEGPPAAHRRDQGRLADRLHAAGRIDVLDKGYHVRPAWGLPGRRPSRGGGGGAGWRPGRGRLWNWAR